MSETLAAASPALPTASKSTILVVDDSRMVRTSISRTLSPHYTVHEAANGEQAWEAILLDASLALVLTDLTMPGLDGYGLLTRIRGSATPRIRQLPVIVVSGSDQIEERVHARTLGATELIAKGIGAQELLACVRAHLMPQARGSSEATGQVSGDAAGVDLRTGLSTPAHFAQSAARMYAYSRRHHEAFVFISLHVELLGGTEGLRQALVAPVSQLLRRTIRTEDVCTRLGPLDFLIASQGITAAQGQAFGQRLVQAVEKAQSPLEERGIRVRVRFGVASLIEDAVEDLDSMRRLARERSQSAEPAPAQPNLTLPDEQQAASLPLEPSISPSTTPIEQPLPSVDVLLAMLSADPDDWPELDPVLRRRWLTRLQPLLDWLDLSPKPSSSERSESPPL